MRKRCQQGRIAPQGSVLSVLSALQSSTCAKDEKDVFLKDMKPPKNFGDKVNADTLIAKKAFENSPDTFENVMRYADVFFDGYTDTLFGHPSGHKGGQDAVEAIQNFAGSNKIQDFYTDNAPELLFAGKQAGLVHRTSTPDMPQANGLAESKIRSVKEGTTTILECAGITPISFWPQAMEYFCRVRNFVMRDGDSAYNKRHVKGHLPRKRLPFGSLVDFMPVPQKMVDNMPFTPKMTAGIFAGWHMHAGGKWSGDYYIYPLADFVWNKEQTRWGVVLAQRAKEIFWDAKADGYQFPLREVYVKFTRTHGGMAVSLNRLKRTF